MADKFANHREGLESPATRHWLLVANAGADLDPKPRGIYCQAAGQITIRDEAGTDLAYDLDKGGQLPFRGVRITAIASGTFYGWS